MDRSIESFPYLTSQVMDVHIDLQRATFKSLINPKLRETLVYLDQALESAKKDYGINQHDIEGVFLVGGSTRIPHVRKMIADHTGLDISHVRAVIDPIQVVSHGAAILALQHQPSDAYEDKDF